MGYFGYDDQNIKERNNNQKKFRLKIYYSYLCQWQTS